LGIFKRVAERGMAAAPPDPDVVTIDGGSPQPVRY
jgi:hypothetical protein